MPHLEICSIKLGFRCIRRYIIYVHYIALYVLEKTILKMLTYISQNREIDKAIVLCTLHPIKGQ